jgi:nucleotidyltransferase substrate binding protein (TIGR01987 family)
MTHSTDSSQPEDIRWKQRFQNYQSALATLTNAVELSESRELSDLEKAGLIQAFEYTHEQSWKLLKSFLEFQGHTDPIFGSRDAARVAFSLGIIADGQAWMNMIKSRNLTSHTYHQELADEIASQVINDYHQQFVALRETLSNEL